MINFRLMRHLWLFLAVAEEQNFSRAAKRLGMSQPPLTEQIQVLEQALKAQLFVRSRLGAQLTPVGHAILPAVRKFVQQMEQLELAVREATSGQTGMLTIGAISSAMLEVLPAYLDRLRATQPRLTISVHEIDSVDAVPALRSGDVDLAFARLEGDLGADIQTMAMSQDSLVVALPAGHRLAGQRRIDMAMLADEAFVMFSRRVSPVYFDRIIALCQASGFSPRILHEVRSVTTQVASVGCGQGIGLVPESLRRMAPNNVLFKPLLQKVEVVTTAAAWRSDLLNPTLTLALAELEPACNRRPRKTRRSPA
ncbi:DNA-binding transcriptional regulator, LysR family [Sphaerotilus natans]|jgi:DNA-binding transcriptional LysR family regulator|nr:LysR family transcriptional regulator [Sphaerotilus natans]SIQ88820.1 DNA-binding transcriptional regulator, LysR family [Sphaerotilus natans]